MIEPAATARARGARSIASSLLAAVLAVCGIFTASALAASPRLPIIVYHQIRNTADGPPDSLEAISLDRFKSEMPQIPGVSGPGSRSSASTSMDAT